MKSLSPFDDLVRNTLSRLPGVLLKLEYVSGLRDSAGRYSHWGLARVHGEQATRNAIAEAHSQVFAVILRTPVASLIDQAWDSCCQQRRQPADYLQEISRRRTGLVPVDAPTASILHFSLVLDALVSLAEVRTRASQPTS